MVGLAILNGLNPVVSHNQKSDDLTGSALVSSWYWIRGYGAWLEKDEPAVIDYYSFATALNPGRLAYWRLAAQTIAFDFPAWSEVASQSEYGAKSVEFFERSRPYFDDDPEWFQSGAFLAETAMEDSQIAMDYLEEGVKHPGFSFALGRRYVDQLLQTGRTVEALAFLKRWQIQLSEDEFPERINEVAALILSLEKKLNTEHPR